MGHQDKRIPVSKERLHDGKDLKDVIKSYRCIKNGVTVHYM